MGNTTDREPSLFVMETSMWGNGRMVNIMVKEHTLTQMEESKCRRIQGEEYLERKILRQRRKHHSDMVKWRKTAMKHLLIILSILLLSSPVSNSH